MTPKEFNDLPMLLASRQAQLVLGCDRETLRELRKSYPELGLRLKGMKHYRYRKVVIALLVAPGAAATAGK